MTRDELRQLADTIHRDSGDAIAGERVIAQARSIGKSKVVKGTSIHKMQETTLRTNVLCVLDRAFRTRDDDDVDEAGGEPFQLRG